MSWNWEVPNSRPFSSALTIDTGAGISDVVLYAVSLALEVLVVATPEPTSLSDAYATIQVLATQQQRSSVSLVVNQVSRAGEGRIIRGQLQQVVDRFVTPSLSDPTVPFKLDLVGEVPADPSVREAVQKRHLLLEAYPGSEAAKGITAVAMRLAAP